MVDSTESGSENKLKQHYVYVLIDPSTDKVFYVGKGQGERALDHLKDSLKTEINSKKLERIRAIEESGKLKVMVIGRFATKHEAFAVEATLIHWMYGYENLTNVARGHGADTIRNKGDDDNLEGIDIPVKVRTNNGKYTDGLIEARHQYGVVESVEKIKEFLEMNSNLHFGAVDSSHARWTTIALEINGLKLVVGKYNSPSDKFWIEIQPVSNNKMDKDKLVDLCKNDKWKAKDNYRYAKLPGYGNKLTDPRAVLAETLKYYDELSGNRT